MTDEEIEQLQLILETVATSNGQYSLAWTTTEPTRHDGPGLTGSRYLPVYREVVRISIHEDEPVAWFADTVPAENVALWACEFREFVIITRISVVTELEK